MPGNLLRRVPPDSVITGWDFSTSGVKCLAFDIDGSTVAEVRLTTDLCTDDGVTELNLAQLEGQARASVRAMASKLRALNKLDRWVAGGISATHHTAGRIDRDRCQVRRAICWNDETLHDYHAIGLKRLGGQKRVRELIGGPWAVRYSLSHLVKDEETLSENDWKRTYRILPHGPLAAGYLTGNFDVISVSAAASTGIMDLRTNQWRREMLDALANEENRALAWQQLPRIVDQFEPIGPLHASLAIEAGLDREHVPVIFPTSDDQQAGLVGGGAVDAGQMAVILGTSAVVNASSDKLPATDNLDAMKLNWGPYLWMRCYSNGSASINRLAGDQPWSELEVEARACEPMPDGVVAVPFYAREPSLGVKEKHVGWEPHKPPKGGPRARAALEALAYLIRLGVEQHEAAGQEVRQISVSGGVARNRLMCEILASVLGRPVRLLASDEGPALGAAVTALAGLESQGRRQHGDSAAYTVADAVAQMVRFRETVDPNPQWQEVYEKGLRKFTKAAGIKKKMHITKTRNHESTKSADHGNSN
jgi:sugar (pentulose or hexulose) kinase